MAGHPTLFKGDLRLKTLWLIEIEGKDDFSFC